MKLKLKTRIWVSLGLIVALLAASFMLRPQNIEQTPQSAAENPNSNAPQQSELPNVSTPETDNSAPSPVKQALALIEQQKQIDEALLQELNSGSYSWEEPFVVVDPYNVSPLTALVLFHTSEPVQIGLHIDGKTTQADVDFAFAEYRTVHIIPVCGLYAGTANQVTLTATTQDGKVNQKTIEVTTEALPAALQAVTNSVYISDEKKYNPGFTFMYGMVGIADMKRALDINGDTRWYLTLSTHIVTNYNSSKTLFITLGSDKAEELVICEMSLMGKIFYVYGSNYGAHHEIALTNRNTFLVGGSTNETSSDIIYEIDRQTGNLCSVLDYKKILQRSRVFGILRDNTDWAHLNCITPYNEDVIVSSNYQSTIVKNTLDGTIKWMLADPQRYYAKFQPYFLTPVGKDFEYPYNQHAVEVLPDYDKNPDTVDILLFDNGSSRNAVDAELQRKIRANEIVEPELYSRLVHYRIDEKNMTVEQIWQYGKERPELFSCWRGDANLLGNGNILGCFNVDSYPVEEVVSNNRSAVYTEVDESGKVIWECFTTSNKADNIFYDYRADRLPIYAETANDIKLGTPANNLIPKEILSRYESH